MLLLLLLLVVDHNHATSFLLAEHDGDLVDLVLVTDPASLLHDDLREAGMEDFGALCGITTAVCNDVEQRFPVALEYTVVAAAQRQVYGLSVLAAQRFERGSVSLGNGILNKEESTNIDVTLHGDTARVEWSISAFMNSVDDYILLRPTLIHPTTLAEATEPVWPELRGVLPGYGLMDPNPWGLGFEIRGDKSPHWTGPSHPPTTFGHFGGAGSFLWVDPTSRLIGAAVGTEPFGDWAVEAWAPTNEAALTRYRTR